jgi:hypothetical protein
MVLSPRKTVECTICDEQFNPRRPADVAHQGQGILCRKLQRLRLVTWLSELRTSSSAQRRRLTHLQSAGPSRPALQGEWGD